jgi:hypothetical protein
MKKLIVLATLIAGALAATPARADNLNGTTVIGNLSVLGSPDAFLPNIVETVGPGTEFTYVGSVFTYTANFTDNLLIVTDTCSAGVKVAKCALAARAGGTFELSFFDNQFAQDFIFTTPALDGLGLVGVRTDRVVAVFGEIGNTGTSTFVFLPIPTPEPGSIVLLGTGILGAAGMVRRHLAA